MPGIALDVGRHRRDDGAVIALDRRQPLHRAGPCRLLPEAPAAVKDGGGEIGMVDSANFNTAPVVIDKSLSILAISGAPGSVVGNWGGAMRIEAPA